MKARISNNIGIKYTRVGRTGTGNFHFLWYRKNMVLVQVLEPVLEKFGT